MSSHLIKSAVMLNPTSPRRQIVLLGYYAQGACITRVRYSARKSSHAEYSKINGPSFAREFDDSILIQLSQFTIAVYNRIFEYLFNRVFIFCVAEKDLFTCRDVLWHMVFWGFAVNYVLKINLNLAIVAMVLPYLKDTVIAQCNSENSTVSWTNETQAQDGNVSFSVPNTTPCCSSENVTVLRDDVFEGDDFPYATSHSAIFRSTKTDSPGTSTNRDWHWAPTFGCTGCRSYLAVSCLGGTARSSYSGWETFCQLS